MLAALHQATVVACLLIVRKDGRAQKQMRTFATTTRELVSLREWLLSEDCTHLAMESTGVYWKPVYAILEGALEIVVANARHVKKVPGRMLRVIDLRLLALFFFSKFVVSNHGKSKFSFAPRRVYISEHLPGKRNNARKMDVRRRALSTTI
jgi:Transposase